MWFPLRTNMATFSLLLCPGKDVSGFFHIHLLQPANGHNGQNILAQERNDPQQGWSSKTQLKHPPHLGNVRQGHTLQEHVKLFLGLVVHFFSYGTSHTVSCRRPSLMSYNSICLEMKGFQIIQHSVRVLCL